MKTFRQQLLEDPEFQNYLLQRPNLTESSLQSYLNAATNFVRFTGEPFYKTVHELRSQQNDRIENNIIIRFNPNQSRINIMQFEFIEYLKGRGCTEVSIDSYVRYMRTILSTLGIILPKSPKLDDTPQEWYLLTKDDIKYVLDTANLQYRAIINFAAVTGLRVRDMRSLTIRDFMTATEEYHGCTEVEDFLDSAPDGMIGFWELFPQKTRKFRLPCKVCNTPESSDLLLFSLNERVKYFEWKNEKDGTDLKITKNDPLFASRQRKYKNFIAPSSISWTLSQYSEKLSSERERVFKYKLEHGEISQETYDESVATIPKFHAHGLRKFFISTLAKNRVDARISALMEGHKAPLVTDSHYINNDYLKETIKEEYMRCIPDLSFENVEVRFLTSEERKSLQQKIDELQEENENMKKDMEKYIDDAVHEKMKDAFENWLNIQDSK